MKTLPKLNCVGLAVVALSTGVYHAQAKQPNIVVILADDMGYSDIGCYGGEIETPNIDRLARNGIRYKQFYNCARSCPSRASLLTGLYPHQAGMGWMAAADLQLPPYQGYLNRNCVTIAEVLKSAGYETHMSGKWHVSSDRQNEGNVLDNWPNQRGFDEFYGIVDGAANYFKTIVNVNNDRMPSPDDGSFYFTHAISDHAVDFIAEHPFAEKPLFLYVAYTAPHWPLHALQRDIDKYVERYKVGWDVLRRERFERQKAMGLFPSTAVLSPRDERVPAWDSLSPEEQKEFVMRMAIYAAQIDAMDQGIGRIVTGLAKRGELDNTLILFMSDNGACAEFTSRGKRIAVDGKEDTYESYRINWANLSSTPYREYKHYTNEGGIASPLVVHYPNGINKALKNKFVDEYGHFTDVMATCVDLSGAAYPEIYNGYQITPMQGVSLAPNFRGERTKRTVTYWEHEANIGLRDGKWKIVTRTHEGEEFDPHSVELYDMEADPTEMNNLAGDDPGRVAEMYARWEAWARETGVFPLDTRMYGVRQQQYQRDHINGEFDENFGGWNVIRSPKSGVVFSIDTVNTVSGGKTARVDIEGIGGRPLDAHLKWVFVTTAENNTASVSFQGRSSAQTTILVRLEEIGNKNGRVFEKHVVLGKGISQPVFDGIPLPAKGRYQLLLLFGGSEKSTCWIDDVRLRVD